MSSYHKFLLSCRLSYYLDFTLQDLEVNFDQTMSINPGSSTEPLSSGSDDQSTLTDTDSNGEIVDGHDLNDLGEFVLKLLISPKSSQNTNKDSGHILNDPIPQASPTEIAATIRTLLCQIGEDTNRDGLKKTPERYAKALQFFTQGYKEKSNELINGAIFNEDTEDMVIVSGIDVFSLCEHHMLPFFGKVCLTTFLHAPPKDQVFVHARVGIRIYEHFPSLKYIVPFLELDWMVLQ